MAKCIVHVNKFLNFEFFENVHMQDFQKMLNTKQIELESDV